MYVVCSHDPLVVTDQARSDTPPALPVKFILMGFVTSTSLFQWQADYVTTKPIRPPPLVITPARCIHPMLLCGCHWRLQIPQEISGYCRTLSYCYYQIITVLLLSLYDIITKLHTLSSHVCISRNALKLIVLNINRLHTGLSGLKYRYL